MKSLSSAAVFLLLAASCPAKVIYVSTYAPSPIAPAWGDAYNTLQEAINAASPGDEVWVAKGTYSTLSTVNGTFLLPSGVALYGGFAGTETSRDQRDAVNNATILDGAQRYRVLTIADNAASSTVIDGFTIQNGFDASIYGGVGKGGGIYIGGRLACRFQQRHHWERHRRHAHGRHVRGRHLHSEWNALDHWQHHQ